MADEQLPPGAEPTTRAGEVVGDRYVIIGLLGRGGMGEVYLAEDRTLRRRVALKRVRAHLAEESDVVRMVGREAQALARLRHPGVVQVHDVVMDASGATVLVLEYVPGNSLEDLSHEALSWAECARLGVAVCDALAAAHAEGVIHRDIKPSNILVEPDGRVRVADFGIARLADATASATGVIGTPGYIAPEIVMGEASPSVASDLYSLTAVLYELACGHPPFVAANESPAAVLLMHVRDEVPDPSASATDLPDPARALLLQGLAKDPSRRFHSADDMAAALRASVEPEKQSSGGKGAVAGTEPTKWHVPPRKTAVSPEAQTRLEEPRPSAAAGSGPSNKRPLAVAAALVLVLVVAGVVIALAVSGGGSEAQTLTQASAARPAQQTKTWDRPPAYTIKPGLTPYVASIETSMGSMIAGLDAHLAPKTVNNFVFLSRQGFYDGLTFHRVIPDFVIQGGDPEGTGQGGPGYQFDDELPERGAYKVGSLAMANAGPDTNGSQFFIIVGRDGVALPPDYTLFGHLLDGASIKVAKAISEVPTDGEAPKDPVVIKSIVISADEMRGSGPAS